MAENKPQPNKTEKTRTQKIEEFLLNPDKVVFESLEEFQSAVQELLDLLSAVDVSKLEMLQGEDGVTPKRGVDYWNEADIAAFEAFILSKIPRVGQDLPSVDQVQAYIRAEVAKIPRIKGDKGDALKYSELSDKQKAELRGKDGTEIDALEILKKIRSVGKNQMLKIGDIRGLEKVLRGLVDTAEEFEDLKKRFENQKYVFNAGSGGEGGAGGLEDIAGLIEAGDNVAITGSGTLADPYVISLDAPDGGVVSIVAGDGIEVDDTDPANPIVKVATATLAAITDSFKKSTDDTDDITVGATNKFATAAEKTKLGYISVTQAVDLDAIETNSAASKVKTDHITVTQPVDLDAIETRVNQLDAAVVLKGTWDASAGTFPGSGAAQAGESWIVSVGGTVDGQAFTAGDRIIAILDNASTTTFASNWFKADYTDLFTAQTLGDLINSSSSKTTPVDADHVALMDSAASNVAKKLSWANIKATLKTYFDTLYQTLNSNLTTIAGLTPTTDNFIVSVSSAWASRTPAQVKTTLSLNNVDNTSNATERAATATLTNKRITKRIGTTASSSTPTPDADAHDQYNVTALAAGATFGAPTGTPTDGQRLVIRVKDNGTARSLAFNAIYRAIGVTLPTTTVINKTLYLGCIYNSADSKWDVTAYAVEA